MTEADYKEKQARDTNQLKKVFEAGYQKGRKEGIDEMLVSALTWAFDAEGEKRLRDEAERLKEQKG